MRKRKNFSKSSKPKKKREGAYNQPNQEDLDKLENELASHLKHLNEDGSVKKKLTESQRMSIIRGAIREKWMYHHLKLAYLQMGIVPDYDESTRRRFKVQCEHCKEWFTKADIQVDHKKGENSLKTVEDIHTFFDSLFDGICFDDLQRLCEECHTIKTVCERYNLTEEEAITFKKVTTWEKQFPKATQQKQFLINKGYKASEVSNTDKRRLSALDYFGKEG